MFPQRFPKDFLLTESAARIAEFSHLSPGFFKRALNSMTWAIGHRAMGKFGGVRIYINDWGKLWIMALTQRRILLAYS